MTCKSLPPSSAVDTDSTSSSNLRPSDGIAGGVGGGGGAGVISA